MSPACSLLVSPAMGRRGVNEGGVGGGAVEPLKTGGGGLGKGLIDRAIDQSPVEGPNNFFAGVFNGQCMECQAHDRAPRRADATIDLFNFVELGDLDDPQCGNTSHMPDPCWGAPGCGVLSPAPCPCSIHSAPCPCQSSIQFWFPWHNTLCAFGSGLGVRQGTRHRLDLNSRTRCVRHPLVLRALRHVLFWCLALCILEAWVPSTEQGTTSVPQYKWDRAPKWNVPITTGRAKRWRAFDRGALTDVAPSRGKSAGESALCVLCVGAAVMMRQSRNRSSVGNCEFSIRNHKMHVWPRFHSTECSGMCTQCVFP